MAVLNDPRPLGRSNAPRMPRRHAAEIFAPVTDKPRRVPADVSRAMHRFMQIDDRAFQRALLHVNEHQHAAKLPMI
jgi:hypothetical protein